jgi:hypothetical protein
MSWLEFVASIIDSLAWPAVILAAAWMLKDRIALLIPHIAKLKYKDFELELKETKLISEATGDVFDQKSAPELDRLCMIAEISPRSAIVESWILIEKAAAETVKARNAKTPGAISSYSPMRLGEYLFKKELINEKQLIVFHNLRELRNKAVHLSEETIKTEEAVEYATMALSFIDQIEG